MGETALRGLYHVLATSLLVIICFVKNDLPDREINLWQPLSTKGLAKRSSFFNAELFLSRARNFQTNRAARREAGKLPRSPRFKWRAGTPYPPVYLASGADGIRRKRNARTE